MGLRTEKLNEPPRCITTETALTTREERFHIMAENQSTTATVAPEDLTHIEHGTACRVEAPLHVASDLLHSGTQLLHSHLEGLAPGEAVIIEGRTFEAILTTLEQALEKIDPERLPWYSRPDVLAELQTRHAERLVS